MEEAHRAFSNSEFPNHADWIAVDLGRQRALSSDKTEQMWGVKSLREISHRNGPPEKPADPNTYAWATYRLAEVTGKEETMNQAKEAAERSLYFGLLEKIDGWLRRYGTAALIVFALANLITLSLTSTAAAHICPIDW